MEIVLDNIHQCFKFIIIYNTCKFNENCILQIISHKCKNNFNEQFKHGSLRSDLLYDEESDKENLDQCTIIVDQLSLENCEFRWKVSGF